MKSELPLVRQRIRTPSTKPQKYSEAAAEVAAFARYGAQVLRIKTKTLAAIGQAAEQAGIKQIGHGRIVVASENAEKAIETLGALAQDLIKSQPVSDPALILDILRLVREFNAQLIHTAQVHLSADKQSTMEPTGRLTSLPQPRATVMIAIDNKGNGAVDDKGQ